MNLIGTGDRLSDIDIPRIGKIINVGEDEIHAVLDVETRGGGFKTDKSIKKLFEPHIFYRQLSGPQREQAVRMGLAYKRWNRRGYKGNHSKFIKAVTLNKDAALSSTSWGLGQIMGFNHGLAGYHDAESMVKSFLRGEKQQLSGMVTFIKNSGLGDELRSHDWRGFARGYNGAGYAKNDYHNKLARAYAKWAKIPDTPFDINRDAPEDKSSLFSVIMAIIRAIFGVKS